MTDATQAVSWTLPDAQRIARAVGAVEHQLLPITGTFIPRREYPPQETWYYVKLATDITAGSLSVPTTFTFDIWLPDTASMSDPKPFIVATDSSMLGVTGVNRSVGTATTGTMLKVEYGWGEWSPKWEDCPA